MYDYKASDAARHQQIVDFYLDSCREAAQIARPLAARFVNLSFDVTGTPAYTGAAVVDYTLHFAPTFRTFSASCRGRIYPTGQDPFAPGATPYVELDCAYLNGYSYRRVPLD